ncbi:hypothetical protein ACFX2H_005302 [Malus domestica]
MRLTSVPVRVLIPPMVMEYNTPRITALQKLLTTTDWSGPVGNRRRMLVATGIIITAVAKLCIHMLMNTAVPHIPSSNNGGFKGSP